MAGDGATCDIATPESGESGVGSWELRVESWEMGWAAQLNEGR